MTANEAPAWRGVWVYAADSGCGACAQSVQALQATRYGALLHRHGVRFARSPRHADVILLTGACSAQARAPLRRVLAATPQPRALVAVGDCAIDGCVFRGSGALLTNPAEMLNVNVEIAGCPPAPIAILDAIVAASQLLAHQPARPAADSAVGDAPAAAQEPGAEAAVSTSQTPARRGAQS